VVVRDEPDPATKNFQVVGNVKKGEVYKQTHEIVGTGVIVVGGGFTQQADWTVINCPKQN
jgi:hypothetical protein